LQKLAGKDVDDAIAAMLDRAQKKGEAALPVVLIEVVGRRRIQSAVPALRAAVGQEDEAVRLAAIKALGSTGSLNDLPVLTARLVRPKTPAEESVAREALRVACRRMPDRDACAAKLVESMAGAPAQGKCRMLEVFSALGGTGALRAVVASAGDSSEEIRDTAARVLGEWKSEDAAGELLELVKKSKDSKDRLRFLRGLSHIIRTLGFPKEERLGFCQKGMDAAQTDEERKIVLTAFAGIPAPETLEMLKAYYTSATLKEDACSAAVTIGERLIRSKRDAVRKAMKEVLLATDNKDLADRARKLYRRAGGQP
jgi:hypothetical protein